MMTAVPANPLGADDLAALQSDVAMTNEQLRLANILVASEFRGVAGPALISSVLQTMALNGLARAIRERGK